MRAYSAPMTISAFGTTEQRYQKFEKLSFSAGTEPTKYNEAWLQDVIDSHPSILPIDDIEPGLADVVSICRELPTPSGFIDNLLMTPTGGIVIVEAKLWRNPQARREVVGQILDYAKDLGRWTYEDLERAIKSARRDRTVRLVDLMRRPDHEPDEVRFVDAVTRNLKLGRFLCIVAGDGIREGTEKLAEFLQQHVGLHFTLSLVELSLWKHPAYDDILIQPRIIARTVQIERAVIRMDSGTSTSFSDENMQRSAMVSSPRASTITEQQFYEQLGAVDASLPAILQSFIADIASIGVYPHTNRSLNFKWRDESGREMNLGSVTSLGLYDTNWVNLPAAKIGRINLAHNFLRSLSSLIPGGEVKETKDEESWRVVLGGKTPPVRLFLSNMQLWKDTMIDYIQKLSRAEDG
jgi:hypothetical protein